MILDTILENITLLLTKKDKQGNRAIRNNSISKKTIDKYLHNRFERHKRNTKEYQLGTMIDFFREFSDHHTDRNNPFVINVNKNQNIDVQIIHPSLLNEEDINRKEFGFTIHLPFDTSDEYQAQEHKEFLRSDLFPKFSKTENQEIEDYYIDCHQNLDSLVTNLKDILILLKSYTENDSIYIDHWEYK